MASLSATVRTVDQASLSVTLGPGRHGVPQPTFTLYKLMAQRFRRTCSYLDQDNFIRCGQTD
jgi:hypothetical protein